MGIGPEVVVGGQDQLSPNANTQAIKYLPSGFIPNSDIIQLFPIFWIRYKIETHALCESIQSSHITQESGQYYIRKECCEVDYFSIGLKRAKCGKQVNIALH